MRFGRISKQIFENLVFVVLISVSAACFSFGGRNRSGSMIRVEYESGEEAEDR